MDRYVVSAANGSVTNPHAFINLDFVAAVKDEVRELWEIQSEHCSFFEFLKETPSSLAFFPPTVLKPSVTQPPQQILW
jgi:hypothetical protein